jgi:hypothetical protein
VSRCERIQSCQAMCICMSLGPWKQGDQGQDWWIDIGQQCQCGLEQIRGSANIQRRRLLNSDFGTNLNAESSGIRLYESNKTYNSMARTLHNTRLHPQAVTVVDL